MDKKNKTISQIDRGTMKRVLGIRDLFSIGYGDLGSSIYYALGITALHALGATPLALALAGLVFAFTALTYAEMSAVAGDSGGSATFSRHAFNDLVSFIAGWGLLLDYIVTIAISSYAIAPYLSYFFPILTLTSSKIVSAVSLIGVLWTLNVLGIRHSVRLSSVLTFLTLITQLLIIVIGFFYFFQAGAFFHSLAIGVKGSISSPSWSEFWKGTAMAMVAYTGIESMAQLSSEAKQPSKTVPKAILCAMGTLLFVYLGLSIVALSALSPKVLSTKFIEDPIAGIVSALPFGRGVIAPWVGILGACILFVASNAGLIGASRLSFKMGEYYQLPRLFYRLHPRFKTPFISLAFFALLASGIVVWSGGKLSFLADLYNFGAMLAFFSAHLSLIMHRIKHPKKKRPFKVPFNVKIRGKEIPLLAVLGALITFSVWCLIVFTKPEGRNLGAIWLILGLMMYFLYRKKHQMHVAGRLFIEKVKVKDFHKILPKKILVPTRGGGMTDTVQVACQMAKLSSGSIHALYVIEVPFSLSLNAPLPHKEKEAEISLKRTEAIGREYGVTVEMDIVRSRSVSDAIVKAAEVGGYDLTILGVAAYKRRRGRAIGEVVDQVVKKAPSRVWVCRHPFYE